MTKTKPKRNGLLRIEKAVLCAFVTACVAMTATGLSVFGGQCDDVRQKVFRLHILANSDSAADQALKLKVRDRILEASGTLFAQSGGKAEAMAEAKKNLAAMESVAEAEVRREGYSYPVRAEIVHMYFPTRTYGDVTLPAGDYDALRILIGAAKGHNWWCVLFPSLCLPSAQGEQKLDDVLGAEAGILKGADAPRVEIRFKTVELFEQLKQYVETKIMHEQQD